MAGSADFNYQQDKHDPQYFDDTALLTNDGWVRTVQKYVVTYDVDDHLNVNNMSVGVPYAVIKGNTLALDEAPKFSLFVKYQDSDQYESTPILSDITDTQGQLVDLTDLIDNARGVDKLQFVWTTPVAGMSYDNIRFGMSPKSGYYGTVGNALTANIAGFNGLGWVEVEYSEKGAYVVKEGVAGHSSVGHLGEEIHMLDETGNLVAEGSAGDWRAAYNQFMTTKTAEIVPPAKNTPRVINEDLGYTGVTNGKVDVGANQLVVRVENNKASLQSFTGLTSYVTLPEGVTYTGSNAQVTAKVVGKQTLLTINWDRTELGPNEANNIKLDINVNDTLDLPTVAVGLYSIVDQSDTVVPKSIDPALDSDVRVLLGVDLPGLSMMRSVYALETVAGVYQAAGHQVQALAAAANNTGDQGALVTVRANEDGQYILSLANTSDNALQNFRLTATMPQLNDRSVLHSDLRGSTTDGVHMTGPIELPASWTDKANIDVRYTTKDDQFGVPAAQIADFSTVTGFVVTFVDPDAYLDGGLQSLIVPVHVDGDATPGTQAFISYSLMANDLTMTEGLKAGIEVGARQQASATVTYHDDTTDTDLLVVDAAADPSLTGFVGGTSTYNSTPVIAEFSAQGYALVSDGTKQADGTSAITFDTDGATTNYVVHLQHTYTVAAPHTLTRTIHYVAKGGKQLAPDHVDAASFAVVTDNVTGAATTYVANGQVTSATLTNGVPDAAWQRDDSAVLPNVVNPKIAQYVVAQTTDPSGDLEQTPSMVVTAKNTDTVVTVTYTRAVGQVAQNRDAQLTVQYVDKYGKELRPTLTKAGFVGNGYTVTAPDIAGYTLTTDRTATGKFTQMVKS
ncbi:mucin-binding protein [Lacticaseibacillus sharpeae]|uniref:mucin-binding protein n=1 Tax=Lacticaseibacillus sharpeae TaxID=1626 RepID=UPI0009E68F9D|nr:MucBP domain-containing protein [Lacticaseibacillus sharpeae]